MLSMPQNHVGRMVALLAEGVDRNFNVIPIKTKGFTVALLAEGVDRNHVTARKTKTINLSPSSRRAWIEIGTKT